MLRSNGDMGVCWPEMETWVLAGWLLARDGDMVVRWPEMETWVFVGWVLMSNVDMGVCWVGAGKQWKHGCELGGC